MVGSRVLCLGFGARHADCQALSRLVQLARSRDSLGKETLNLSYFEIVLVRGAEAAQEWGPTMSLAWNFGVSGVACLFAL